MVEAIQIKPVAGDDYDWVIKLLKHYELCYEDIPSDHIKINKIEVDRQPAGVFGFEIYDEYAILRSVAVAPEFRGQKLGIAIMEQIPEAVKQLNIKALYLLTTTADGFFERFGFTRMDRNKVPSALQSSYEFKNFCPDSAVCMVRTFQKH